ncbi:type I restriction endonuclease [Frondihabitans sp. 4ASC-45]|uniref:type I restriction endonuclease subunit R n=1 Tax=Frondihabitans sp. 4ASC-45 TaxID=3111636 RepID=UPI003C20FF66
MHEEAFESELCTHLAANGWLYSPTDAGYDRERALFPEDLLVFLQETQPDDLAKVVKPEGTDAQQAQGRSRVLDRVVRVLATDPMNSGGTLNVLKRPIGVTPASLSLFQSRPATDLNATTEARFAANRVRVMRQVSYSTRNGNRLDLVLFVNGIPVATVEIKTDLTQNAAAALKQYAQDRVPVGEPLLAFGRGALVHFVVSNELVFMTTKLAGVNTYFLPFNQGRNNGAGNPNRDETSPTAFFWEETLQRETWLDIVGRFLHYRFEERQDPLTGAKTYDRQVRFPRYHQWRAVTKLEATIRSEGPGGSYLIQHSAGSGKTDSIAWTAHRMASLHTPVGRKVFDGVIVVSDRQVLDGQLQRAVEQLESRPGVFEGITSGSDGSKSAQLAQALLAGRQIIGVTLQTFPFALDVIEKDVGLADRTYAVIADEAHSSQSGEAAASLKQVLTASAEDDENLVDSEAVLADLMDRNVGGRGTISFFAFTATPKGKTLELFGRPDQITGVPGPFDLYSMKQAIEEGFILDVLKNYLPYDLAFTVAHAHADRDVEVDTKKANTELMRWVRLHPVNIAQKVAVIVEHFRANVSSELGGRAKAMVVTASRLEAVRYKTQIDAYIKDHGLTGVLGTLVAFSGSVADPDTGDSDITEATSNPGLHGRRLEAAFAGEEYQVMIVASKFQTGFDQPLLVGMYVDKKLSGITAVQTLSRLNRVIPGKENTYILDFVNDPAEILAAFQVYYEEALLTTPSDPDVIHDMLGKLQGMHIVDEIDVDQVVDAWINKISNNTLYSRVKTSRDRFWDRWRTAAETSDDLERARLEDFRGTVNAFVRSYDFLSQIINYEDTRVEKWAIFLRVFRRVIERDEPQAPVLDLDDVILTHYRLRRMDQQSLGLTQGEAGELAGITEGGSGQAKETKYGWLSEIINQLNTLFAGSGLGETDQVNSFESVFRHAVDNPQLQAEAMANTQADFDTSPTIHSQVEELLYTAGEGHEKAISALLQMEDIGGLIKVLLQAGLYERLRSAARE